MSVGQDGRQGNGGSLAPSISANGRYVAFYSFATNLVPADTNDVSDLFVHDRKTGTNRRLAVAPGSIETVVVGTSPAISADARSVAFESDATNLVPGDTNGFRDVFVHTLTRN